MTSAVFSYLGAELVGVTVGEAQNPRRAIPRAVKLTFFRIVFCSFVWTITPWASASMEESQETP